MLRRSWPIGVVLCCSLTLSLTTNSCSKPQEESAVPVSQVKIRPTSSPQPSWSNEERQRRLDDLLMEIATLHASFDQRWKHMPPAEREELAQMFLEDVRHDVLQEPHDEQVIESTFPPEK